MQLQIETLNVCNADCIFCPYAKQTRRHELMPVDLFRRIIDDARSIPQIDHVTLTGLGEPLLDPHLIERLKYVRGRMQLHCLDLFTNGSRLDERVIDDLIRVPVDYVWVSLNSVDAYQRREIMRLDDFDRVVEMCDLAIRKSKGTRTQFVVKSVIGKDLQEIPDTEEFMRRWGGDHKQGGNAFCHLEGNWAGTTWPMRTRPRKACARAWGQIMVLSSGEVALCCFDANGEVILGDLRTQTIREVYNGPAALGVRQAHYDGNRKDLRLCKDCTAI